MIQKYFALIINFSLAVVLIFTQSWIGDALSGQELFAWSDSFRIKFGDSGWLPLLILVELSVFSAILLYQNRKTFLPVQVQRISEPDKVNSNQVLILAVSRASWTWSPEKLERQSGEQHELPSDLKDALNAMSELNEPRNFFSWEQLLRAVYLHRATVNRIVLIGSPGVTGTSKDFEACRDMLRYYFSTLSETVFEKREANFDSLDELMDVYRNVIISEPKRQHEIMIDVTGGTKVVSIAAAMATLKYPDIEFQYVETEGEKRVRSFNVTAANAGY